MDVANTDRIYKVCFIVQDRTLTNAYNWYNSTGKDLLAAQIIATNEGFKSKDSTANAAIGISQIQFEWTETHFFETRNCDRQNKLQTFRDVNSLTGCIPIFACAPDSTSYLGYTYLPGSGYDLVMFDRSSAPGADEDSGNVGIYDGGDTVSI